MKPLQGIRIVSVEQFGAGPYATMILADLGAEVIKVENAATGGDPARKTGPYFLGENEPVDSFRRLFIDGDIYALTGDNVLRYFNGRRVTSYALSDPPDGQHFHAPIEIAVHHVGTADPVLADRMKVEDPRMFEETAEDRSHAGVLGNAGNTGP